MGKIHFIADVHLKDGEEKTWESFFNYLTEPVYDCSKLYLLGDIFHAWVGDDDQRDLARIAQEKLQKIVASGIEVFFIIGNHDFMIGNDFAKNTGVTLLGEQAVIKIANKNVLLIHGDILCTNDVEYLKARKKIYNKAYLFMARNLPIATRLERADKMLNNKDKSGFHAKELAVDESLVKQLLKENNSTVMIHGHIHQDGLTTYADNTQRWVLPDWIDKDGGWLVADEYGFHKVGNWSN